MSLNLRIDIRRANDQELQFIFVEYLDQIQWDDIAEAGHERVELTLDAFAEAILDKQVHIFHLILFGYFDIVTPRLKLECFDFVKLFFCDCKMYFTCDVVFAVSNESTSADARGSMTHSIRVNRPYNSASTLSTSARLIFLLRIFL